MSKSPLRVLHVIDQLTGGGAEVSLVEYLAHAGRRDEPAHTVLVLNGQPESAAVAETLPVDVVMGRPGRRPRWSDASLVSEAIERVQPDLVHCALVRSTLASARALRGTSLPMLVTLTSVHYDVEDREGSLKKRWGIRLAHALHGVALRRPRVRFHAVAKAVAEKAVTMFGLDPSRIEVVPRGRPDPRSRLTGDRPAIRATLDIPDDAPVAVTVAREHLVKNHVSLLEAIAELRSEFQDLKVVLIGGRSTGSEAIDETVTRLGLESQVLRLGHRSDVPDLLEACDVFVSVSRSEGLPGAIVEAIGMGLPVVAFDVPGVGDVLGDGYPGLVSFGAQERLTEHIRDLLRDPDGRALLGAAGRERFEEQFEIEAYSRRMTEIYRSVADRTADPNDRTPMGINR